MEQKYPLNSAFDHKILLQCAQTNCVIAVYCDIHFFLLCFLRVKLSNSIKMLINGLFLCEIQQEIINDRNKATKKVKNLRMKASLSVNYQAAYIT